MKTLVTMGRGGTGKTSFVALMTKYLIGTRQTPLLLVDIDPDQNLAEMVGVDLEHSGVKTIAELVTDTFIRSGGTAAGIAPTERIESRIWEEGLYEGSHFDLIAVGTKWIEGCYCLPDSALKSALGTISRNYRFLLVDSPAGLEHLNRKITNNVDTVFDIIGPSSKSFEHVRRARRIIRETGITTGHFYIVGGYQFPVSEESRPDALFPHAYLGKVARDEVVENYVFSGRSLLDVPDDSPAYCSVKEIMKRSGN
jgi:CO dehydrogenase maturation factor